MLADGTPIVVAYNLIGNREKHANALFQPALSKVVFYHIVSSPLCAYVDTKNADALGLQLGMLI
jgi:hypothetical protein